MDKKELIQSELKSIDLVIASIKEDIEKYTILGDENRVEYKRKSLGYFLEDKEKYEEMLAATDECVELMKLPSGEKFYSDGK